MKHYLAVDAGTTRIKAGLFNEEGSLIGMTSRFARISMPNRGWCEMDMEELWQLVSGAIYELGVLFPKQWKTLEAVGIAAQGEGAWLLDNDGKPVRNAILWNDSRNDQISRHIWEEANLCSSQNHAVPLCVGSPLAILNWLKEYEPHSYSRIEHVIYCKDWLNYRLTGKISTDWTDASTTAIDVINKKRVTQLFKILGIKEMTKKFPRILQSGEIMGRVSAKGSISTGIPEGTPVIAGCIDISATSAGLGAVAPGDSGTIIGTTLGNIVILGKDEVESMNVEEGSILCHVKDGSYLRQMSALSGAVVLDWCRKELGCGAAEISANESEAKAIPPGSEGVVFLPYLFGERAPFKAPDASAVFYGIRFNHTRAHLIRAVYEGLAYSMYDCLTYIPKGRAGRFLAGGGSKSDLLCQIISDLTGEEVFRSNREELGLYGILKVITGNWEEKSSPSDRFYPDGEKSQLYMRMFGEFLRIRDKLITR